MDKNLLPPGSLVCTCKDCSLEFVLSKREQDFYVSKKLELPKRCQLCRQKRKVLLNQGAKI